MNKWCEKEISKMIETVAATKTPEDVCNLFDKILTPREINDMARRMIVLEMIEAGESYSTIAMKLKMSSNTISKISGKIGYGFRRSSPETATKTKLILPRIVDSGIRYKGASTYTIKFK